ncbi:MAG: M56 family metallopeptidase [Ferruginibacter sp.]|nr:M56 family metallopeptidase [Cytophagales bacterium]
MKVEWLTYLLESGVCLAMFYGLYRLLLHRETFFAYNRGFILLAVGLSLVLPLVRLPVPADSLSVVPAWRFIAAPVAVAPAAARWNWSSLALGCYGAVSLALLLRLLVQLIGLVRMAHQWPSQPNGAYRLVLTGGQLPTFSFFRLLFWAEDGSLSPEGRALVLRHELAHIRQWHSADVLLLELVRVAFWFHPAVYGFKKDLREIHEYLADRAAVGTGNPEAYIRLMASQLLSRFQFSFIQPFSQFKFNQRIRMIQLSQRAKPALWKIAVSLTLLTGMVFVYACTKSDRVDPVQTTDRTKANERQEAPPKEFYEILGRYKERHPDLIVTMSIHQADDQQQEMQLEVSGVDDPTARQEIKDVLTTFILGSSRGRIVFSEKTKATAKSQVYTVVEQMPEFRGGQDGLMQYLSKSVAYPPVALQKGTEGTVYVSFVVSNGGTIGEANVVKGVSKELDEEALRVIRQMPAWQPGKQNGKAVAVKYTLPIRFKVD